MDKENVEDKKYLNTFNVVVFVIYTLMFLYEYFVLSHYSQKTWGKDEFNWGLAVFLTQFLYTVVSLKSIGPTELGALLVFGRPVKKLESGLVFIPFGFCTIKTETRLVIQNELPADPEKIFRPKKDESEVKIPDGMFPPIRIPFGYPTKAGLKNSDPLDNRITAEVVPVVRWQITNYLKFLVKIGDREEAVRQMEDTTVVVLIEQFALVTPAVALKNLKEYNKELKKELKKVVRDWGIELRNAEIKTINFSRKLNAAILGVPEADLKKQSTIFTAQGEKEKLILEGEGAAAAKEALEKAALSGKTAGLVEMAKKLGVSPELVLSALTAQKITESGNKVIIAGSEGFSNLAAMAGAIGETVKKGGSK